MVDMIPVHTSHVFFRNGARKFDLLTALYQFQKDMTSTQRKNCP